MKNQTNRTNKTQSSSNSNKPSFIISVRSGSSAKGKDQLCFANVTGKGREALCFARISG